MSRRPTHCTLHDATSPQADGSDIYAFEGGYAFALITDHGYVAYRIPVEDDHILMIPGKTDYLYDSRCAYPCVAHHPLVGAAIGARGL